MNIVSTRDLQFRDKELYKGTKKTGYSITQDPVYMQMYRVVYPDGELSADMYNATRAKEHCYRLVLGITDKPYDAAEKGKTPNLDTSGNAQRSPLVRLNDLGGTSVPSTKNNEPVRLLPKITDTKNPLVPTIVGDVKND